jgi:uncharacterized membrane protein YeiB
LRHQPADQPARDLLAQTPRRQGNAPAVAQGPVTLEVAQSAIATSRTPGFDVARAIAVLGMALINYRGAMEATERGPAWLNWSLDRFEGRAAALFVVLAGLGISLRSRRARSEPKTHMKFERRALLKRAALLYVLGLLNLHLWEWDILHFYGLFLALAACLIAVPDWGLWAVGLTALVGSIALHNSLPYGEPPDIWTLKGLANDLLFGGLHPAFPWMAFITTGMWLGRRDLSDRKLRRRILGVSLGVATLAEAIDSVSLRAPALLGIDETWNGWLAATPRPPLPVYTLAGGSTAVAAICLCIAVTEKRPGSRWVVALTATGQLAFTLYIAHAIAIVVPQSHNLFEQSSAVVSTVYSLLFYAVGVVFAVWWRQRWPQGPLEGLIRQITGRHSAAPWGGIRLSEAPPPPRQS